MKARNPEAKVTLLNDEEVISRNQRRIEIVVTLLQHGWDTMARQLGLMEMIPGGWRKKLSRPAISDITPEVEEAPPLPVPSGLRKTLEALGPTFIKLGQMLSTRADLLPEEYIEELKKLQAHVPALPWEQMEAVVLDEWNTKQKLLAQHHGEPEPRPAVSVLDIFETFDPLPLAAGSLGQAYRATLSQQNRPVDVIVKVRRPGIVPVVEADIAILKDLARLATRTKWGKVYNFMEMVNEFANVIRSEMDFSQEAQNTVLIGQSLKKVYEHEVVVPEIYWTHCGPRMMTMEFMEGEQISDLFTSRIESVLSLEQQETGGVPTALDLERQRIAEAITNIFLHQIFIEGIFHADPHPGNLLIRYDTKQKQMQLALIDFGMVGRVDPRSRSILIDFLLAIIKFDAPRATERIMEFGKAPRDIDRQLFSRDLDHILRSTLGRPLREVRVGKILQDILDMTLRYRVQLPGVFITLLRVLITTEGICRQLDRDYILIRAAEPFVVQAIKTQFMQHFTARDLARLGLEVTNVLTGMPRQVDDLLTNLNNGKMEIISEHRNLNQMERELRIMGSRIATGLMVGGLTIASAVSMTVATGPTLLGLPLVSLGLFTLSGLLGMWLLNAINRKD